MPELTVEQIRNAAAEGVASRLEPLENKIKALEETRASDDSELNTRRAELLNASKEIRDAVNVTRSAQSLDLEERHSLLRNTSLYKNLNRPQNREIVNGMGNFLRAMAAMKANSLSVDGAASLVERAYKDTKTANMIRALNTQEGSAGGVLNPLEYADYFIDALRSALMFNRLGVMYTGLDKGKKRFRKRASKVRPNSFAEGNNIGVKQGSFGYVDLVAKDIGVIVPITNDMLDDSDFDTNVLAVTDVITELRLEIERQVLFGAGGVDILGLANISGITQIAGSVAGSGRAKIDLKALDSAYWDVDPLNVSTAYAMHPRVKVAGSYMTSTTGDTLARMSNIASGVFNGYAFADSTQMPYNSGTGASQLIQGDWNDLVIGMASQSKITTSQDATVVDGAGNTLSAFQANMTLVRVIQRVDSAPLRNEVFKILNIADVRIWDWV